MSSTLPISQADGATAIGTVENNAALLMADPRGDALGIALLGFDYNTVLDWASRLHSLAELGDQTSSQLKSILGAVDWKGSGAKAFEARVSQTDPKLATLSQSYMDAADAIFTYAVNAHQDQSDFKNYAAQIQEYTYQLTGSQEQSNGTYTPGTPKVTPNSANYQTVCTELTTAKQKGQSVLATFQTTRATVIKALQQAGGQAEKAPLWWMKNESSVLHDLEGVKGVSKADLAKAENLHNAEKAYLTNPDAKTKAALEADLLAMSTIASAAMASGKKALGTQLLDDEAGSLQHLANHEDGLLGSDQSVTAVQEDKDTVVADLKAGNTKAAESELSTMATATENARGGAHEKSDDAAMQQADAEQKAATQEASPPAHNDGAPASGTSTTGTGSPSQPVQTKIEEMTKQAQALVGDGYTRGGGHGGWGASSTYDCSGFVSKVLHAAGYLSAPQTTQTLPDQPGIKSGPGQYVTIYDRTDGPSEDWHTIIDINGQWYESGGQAGPWGGGGGVEHIQKPSAQYLASFNRQLHPAGM